MKRSLAFPGGQIPLIGLGTYKLNGRDGQKAIEAALECGYRHIDTARMYENEREVGAALRTSGISREEAFVTTKIWPSDFRKVISATEDSLRNLGTDYADLLLLHWPTDTDAIKKAAEDLNEVIHKGYAKFVGVSNFNIELIDMVKDIAPIRCDQVEYHPFLSQEKLLGYLRSNDLFMTAYRPLAQGKLEGNSLLAEIGEKYGKTDAQVALRWIVQQDVVAIPKSASPERIRANIDIFDFELLPAEMEAISGLRNGTRLTTPEWSPKWD
jgi:2,5-diketo-D-gluconate reductase B